MTNSLVTTCRLSQWRIILYPSLAYAIIIILYFYPTFGQFSSSLIGPPHDNLQDFWNTWHSQLAFSSDPASLFFTRQLFFPEGASLRFHTISYPNVFSIFVIRALLGLSLDIRVLVTLHNLMLLLSFYFAAMGAFALTLRFAQRPVPAFVGGFIFAFSPFHFAHSLYHTHVATVQFIPFFVLCVLRYVDRKTVSSFIGSVTFCALGALSSWYYLIYNIYFLLYYYFYCAIRQRTLWLKSIAMRITGVLIVVFILLSPIVLPMLIEGWSNPNIQEGLAKHYSEEVADLVGFFFFHPYHLLDQLYWRVRLINSRMTGYDWEKSVYLGSANIILLLWSIRNRKKLEIPHLSFCIGGMLIFMSFAAGHSLHVLGKPVPYVLLPTAMTEYLPFVSQVRTPSRAMVYVYLFMAVAVGSILAKLCYVERIWPQKWQHKPVLRYATIATLCAFIFFDFYSVARAKTKFVCPKAYDIVIQDQTNTFGVLDLPKGYNQGNWYMAYQICHKRPIVFAIVSRKVNKSLIDTLDTRNLDLQKQQLIGNNVRYIVIHKSLGIDRTKVDQYIQMYRQVYNDQTHIVFQVE